MNLSTEREIQVRLDNIDRLHKLILHKENDFFNSLHHKLFINDIDNDINIIISLNSNLSREIHNFYKCLDNRYIDQDIEIFYEDFERENSDLIIISEINNIHKINDYILQLNLLFENQTNKSNPNDNNNDEFYINHNMISNYLNNKNSNQIYSLRKQLNNYENNYNDLSDTYSDSIVESSSESEENIIELPILPYNEVFDQCVICFDNFVLTDVIISTFCGHIYHQKCIEKWLRRNTLCPLCKKDQLDCFEYNI